MEDLNMKSFYRHEVPVNRKKTDITFNKKTNERTKKLSSRGGAIANTNEVCGFVSPNEISEVEKAKSKIPKEKSSAPIINYDFMINNDKTTSLFNNNKSKKVLSEGTLKRVKDKCNK
jgi:hypothetical protein